MTLYFYSGIAEGADEGAEHGAGVVADVVADEFFEVFFHDGLVCFAADGLYGLMTYGGTEAGGDAYYLVVLGGCGIAGVYDLGFGEEDMDDAGGVIDADALEGEVAQVVAVADGDGHGYYALALAVLPCGGVGDGDLLVLARVVYGYLADCEFGRYDVGFLLDDGEDARRVGRTVLAAGA